MEEGQHPQYAIGFRRYRIVRAAVRIKQVDLPGIGADILVGQHRALGRAGGSAGILQLRNSGFGIAWLRRIIAVIGDEPAKMQDTRIVWNGSNLCFLEQPIGPAFEAGQCLCDAADDQLFEVGLFEDLDRGGQQCRCRYSD